MMHCLLILLISVGVRGQGEKHSEALNMYRQNFEGDATYYGDSRGRGTCSYGLQNPPVASQAKYTVALNSPQFLGSFMCGSCWKVIGCGEGLGNDPVSGNFLAFVNDLCPECQPGDLDLSVDGDGRWKIFVKAVQCPVGSGNIDFMFQGSNSWYLKLQARNTRLPVHVMEIESKGWQRMTHTTDGFFTFGVGPVTGAFRVRLTAINGAQVIDTIPGIQNDVVIKGNQQFPQDNTLPMA